MTRIPCSYSLEDLAAFYPYWDKKDKAGLKAQEGVVADGAGAGAGS